ncbi:MAG TPA: LuxR C-terminal-related transcriptional regulator [Acidimicrobiales bacterium]|nr:LuxR C-terminal-related transcriptional regulator [Acidimicrobiales bacterium]
MTAGSAFIGRAAETATALDILGARAPGVLVLGGQAGVGKTRLAQELVAAWRASDRDVVWMAGTSGTRTLPFGAVARLLPAVGADDPTLGDAAPLSATVISGAIREVASHPTRLLVVDDAHLLDDLSALLVHHLVLARVVPILLTVRSGEPVASPLAALWTDAHAARLDLLNLSQAESAAVIHELLQDTNDAEPDQPTLDALHRASDGNPLLLGELVRDALQAGSLRFVDGTWRWAAPSRAPWGRRLRDAIGRRLGSITDDERALLVLLSAAEPLEVALLRRLAPDVDLDGLERRVLIKVVQDGDRVEVRLAHPLLGEVLHDDLPIEERSRVRAVVAEALGDWPRRRRNDVLRQATLLLDAGASVPPALLVDAGERALTVGDAALAERLGRGSASDRAEVALLLGRALGFQHRFEEARTVLEQALALAVDDAVIAHTAWNLHMLLTHVRDHDAGLDVLRAARAQVADPVWAAIIEGHEIQHLFTRGRSREGTERAERLLAMHDDPRVRLRLVTSAGQGRALAGRTDDALTLAEALLPHALALQAELPMGPAWVVNAQAIALLLAGRLDQAGNLVAAVGQLAAAQTESPGAASMVGLLAGRVELLRGNVDAAAVHLADAISGSPDDDLGGLGRWAVSLRAEALALQGNQVAAEQLAADAMRLDVSSLAFDGDAARARAWVSALGGEVTRAVDELLALADLQNLEGQHALELQSLHDAVRLGGGARAGRRLADVVGLVDGRWPEPIALHLEGLQSGDGAALEAAAVAFDAMGARLHAAEAWSEAARAHERAGLRSRAASSARHRDTALSACGPTAGHVRTPALADATSRAELTRRELEVVQLAALGLSNRSIADRLVVSLRTVEGHLYRAFTKLGVTERDQLGEVLR